MLTGPSSYAHIADWSTTFLKASEGEGEDEGEDEGEGEGAHEGERMRV